MKNIILIGMPGAGKSTVGVVLAKTLGWDYVDTDLVLQKREGLLLQEIIDAQGITNFLRIEEEVLQDFNQQRCVVATGGSVVYSSKAMQHLQAMGTMVYLQLPINTIKERLTNMSSRGIAMSEGQSLQTLYNERVPLYEKYADVVLDCSGQDVEAIVEVVKKKIKEIESP